MDTITGSIDLAQIVLYAFFLFFAWLVLWSHARAWHVTRPQPMLRCVPEAQKVAELLADAVTALAPAGFEAPPASAASAERGILRGAAPNAAMA